MQDGKFHRLPEIRHYENWDQYKVPLDHSWRQDPTGLETGGFCLYLTSRDMAKLGFLFINRGTWDGEETNLKIPGAGTWHAARVVAPP